MQKLNTELIYWLQLAHAPLIGMKTIRKLLNEFKTIDNICRASKSDLRFLRLNEAQIYAIKNADEQLLITTEKWLTQHDKNCIINFTNQNYPKLLSEISSLPPILYISGDVNLLSATQIAIVGSRNPSPTGIDIAKQFAFELAKQNICITSGLALGIDTACHEGALQANGKTIAVLGNGLCYVYPKKNNALAEKIIENGCLVSEWPLNMPPKAENFPRRNRIISGLSLGTLVIEAALKSGSLITAHYAIAQNREVFALPGSVRNPLSTGCHALIQQGAKCVVSAEDVLDELKPFLTMSDHKNSSENTLNSSSFKNFILDHEQQLVLACIESDVTSVDQICEHSKLSAQSVMAHLLILELHGYIRSQLNGYIKI
ncbi:MAG: DNA protecting protein DprA [Gammaproteobacteria bacterium RIFCSPHIGHO2_12_FULL_38_11]|nr:MAG: DNA protecting protein DprA [Gammaproteobacteria bacterium RIFCSPHIGHO2_12_FULL_38_11]